MKSKKLEKYQPSKIEAKWQKVWNERKQYHFELDPKREKYYTLVELPYPSGDLHIGHWFAFVAPDVLSRFKTMNGFNVFFPMGYDAFGLPAENAAIKRNIHPQDWTMSNIKTMTAQFQQMGTMIDWDSTTITCLPEYYRWNQWIFLKMFEKGIAYRSATLSNWCPTDQTVLANEHVENGKCWRCGTEVVQKEVEQWFLKITEYADRLLWDNKEAGKLSNGVDWPKSVKEGQNNWIGKSAGAVIDFPIDGLDQHIKVFTTRPDTLYGATFLVLAPEHPLVEKLTTPEHKDEVKLYQDTSSKKSELERKEMKEKTGVFTGTYAQNPATGESIPVWIGDYVLSGYGTGALMAVPAHDERDYEFAQKYKHDIKPVIEGEDNTLPYMGSGKIINSDQWNGMSIPNDLEKIIEDIESRGIGKKQTQYHLHDWSVSRQRYWGTPVPIIHCADCGDVPVPEKDLPVEIPYDVDYAPKGKPPLASNEKWMNVTCPKCGKDAKRDPETLDTFFDSSWYYYRYVSPHYDAGAFDQERVKKLLPLDIYFGGAEHTLGHTLYARFFTKFFQDLGLISFDEFAKKRIQHGIVLGPDGNKMSKSKGNVINPDDVVKEYGADAVRLYLSFMMPYEATGPWSTTAMGGVFRFLKRIWDLFEKVSGEDLSKEDLLALNKTIKKVTEDMEAIKFNTAVASLMEWLNHLSRKETVSKLEYKTLIQLLAPFAPHITEELWSNIEESSKTPDSIHNQPWPIFDKEHLVEDMVLVVVQVNGKKRAEITIDKSIITDQSNAEEQAKSAAAKFLEGYTVKKTIYVPGKIINFVV